MIKPSENIRSAERAESRPPFFIRNYLCHSIEGGLYTAGLVVVSTDSVLPAMVQSLGGAPWLVSLMPILSTVGWVIPPLFVAHWVQRMAWVKNFVLVTGIFQRLPFLISGLTLLLFHDSFPKITLAIVAFMPFMSGAIAGFCGTAWQELILKTFPPSNRASLQATRNTFGSVMGMACGPLISLILLWYPGALGYAYLHFITFLFLALSFFVFAFVREIGHSPQAETKPILMRENLRQIPKIIRADLQLRNFLLLRGLFNGMYIALPFLSIHALRVTGMPESHLGTWVTFQMLGGIFGNVAAGFWGDRYGSKSAAWIAVGSAIATFSIPILYNAPWAFTVTYFLLGFSGSAGMVGFSTLSMEIANPLRRATYLSVMMLINFPSMIIASAISSFFWSNTQSFSLISALSIFSLLACGHFLYRIQEPRNAKD